MSEYSDKERISLSFKEALDAYKLIEDGDHILSAVSGGKDSLTMLNFLAELQKQARFPFEITAIHIKTDFHCGVCVHESVLTDFFDKLVVRHVIKHIKVLDEKKQTTCFWCSWNRRKCLFETAKELGCNKIALGHHKDDLVETTLLNLFFKGEFSTMRPCQDMFGGKLKIIRPLCFVDEAAIKRFALASGFPQQLCQCPFGAISQRKSMKNIIKEVAASDPNVDVKENVLNGLRELRATGGLGQTRL